MRAFLVAAALSVGLGNALLYSTVGNSPRGGPFVWRPDPGPLLVAHVVSAALAALAIRGALVRFAGRELRGRFFARYGLMVMAICAGGAIPGVLLDVTTVLLDDREPMPGGASGLLYATVFPAIYGAFVGAVEGTILGFPWPGC